MSTMKSYKLFSIIVIALIFINGCEKDSVLRPPSASRNDTIKNNIKVPLTRQALNYNCGASAFQSILYYYGIEYSEGDLAVLLHSDTLHGTRYQNIVSLANTLHLNVETKKNATFNDLKHYLDLKKPVIILIQAWTNQSIVDWKNDWIDGHYVVAIGYDQNNVYFMDPSTLGNYAYIPQPEFMDRWHDIDGTNDTLRHFILSIQKESVSKYDPNKILKID